MAEAKEAPGSLETEVDTALEAADAEVFAKFADKFIGQEAPTAPEGGEGDKTTALSHPKEEPTEPPAAEEAAAEQPPAEKPDSEDDEGLPPELKDRISRRIGKEVAKRKAEQERAEALEAELAELKAKLDKPAETEPEKPSDEPEQLKPVPGLQKLEAHIDKVARIYHKATTYLNQLRREPDKVVAKLQKEEPSAGVEDEESARDFLEEVRDNTGRTWNMLTSRHESQRVHLENQMAAEREQTYAAVKQRYPWVEAVRTGKDTKSAEAKLAARIMKEAPGLDKAPKGWQVIARLVRAELAETAEASAPKATTPIPPRLPTTTKPAAPVTVKPKAEASDLAKRAIESGEIEDVEEYIKASLA